MPKAMEHKTSATVLDFTIIRTRDAMARPAPIP